MSVPKTLLSAKRDIAHNITQRRSMYAVLAASCGDGAVQCDDRLNLAHYFVRRASKCRPNGGKLEAHYFHCGWIHRADVAVSASGTSFAWRNDERWLRTDRGGHSGCMQRSSVSGRFSSTSTVSFCHRRYTSDWNWPASDWDSFDVGWLRSRAHHRAMLVCYTQ